MACFLVSTAEAIVVTAAAKAVKNNEMKAASQKLAKKAIWHSSCGAARSCSALSISGTVKSCHGSRS